MSPILFDSEFLKKLEYLALVSRRVHHGQILANRMTRQRGSGLEFAEHREYVPGDDLRYLDWTVFARHGELLLKRFHEERDLRVDLVLDTSRSMSLGRPQSKFDYARQVTACLACLALSHMDRVSLTVFDEQSHVPFPVTRGKHQWLNFLARLERLETSGDDTRLDAAVDSLLHHNPGGGLAIVVSDFCDPHGYRSALDRLHYQGFEISIVHLYDPQEADPALAGEVVKGDVELVDVETGQRRRITVRPSDLKRYRDVFERERKVMHEQALQRGIGCLSVSTATPFDAFILQTMRRAGWLGSV